MNVEKQLSCSQAVIDTEKHSARVKDLEAAVSSEKEVTAATERQLHNVQAELLSCKAEHQKHDADQQRQLCFCQGELDACRREVRPYLNCQCAMRCLGCDSLFLLHYFVTLTAACTPFDCSNALLQLSMIHKSFAAIEHENNDKVGRSGDLLAQSHMELQHREVELQQLHVQAAALKEELCCTENARSSACQQLQQLSSEKEKMDLVCLPCPSSASAEAMCIAWSPFGGILTPP